MNSECSQPHCSSFSIDRSTPIALGGSQQIVTPAEPSTHPVPQWNPPPVERHSLDNRSVCVFLCVSVIEIVCISQSFSIKVFFCLCQCFKHMLVCL